MKILITGSTGFVGKHLVNILEEADHEIFHLVRSIKGFKNEYVWDFKSSVPDEIPDCDVVIHLAAHVDFSLNIRLVQYNVNTVSAMRLAEYARSQNCYFILASTIGVHGSKYTVIDKDTPLEPENHYSLSKLLAEESVRIFVNNYSILRICGIYGLDGPGHLGLNNSIRDAVHRKIPPVLKGPGKAKRNYICVLDVACWILHLVKRYENKPSKSSQDIQEVLYLSGSEIMTIKDYMQIIVETVSSEMTIKGVEGEESRDSVVVPSKAPFDLITFRQYMERMVSAQVWI